MLCVLFISKLFGCCHSIIASFPGPTQLSIAWSIEWQESLGTRLTLSLMVRCGLGTQMKSVI